MADQLQGPEGGNLEAGSSPISTDQAGSMFATMLGEMPAAADPAKDKPKPATPDNAQAEGGDAEKPLTEQEALEKAALDAAADGPKEGDDPDAEKIFTVKVDGKEIRLTADELINGYKAQKVSTAKFEQAAELRKAADTELARANAEIAAARQDRHVYAQNLDLLGRQIQSALQESAQIDMARLSVENPSEYVKQKHLLDQRQAAADKVRSEQLRIQQAQQADQAQAQQQWRAEQEKAVSEHLAQQQEKLHAKLPDWKDPAKAKAENEKIVSFLQDELGYKPEEVLPHRDAQGNPVYPITDHRIVIMARESMLYRQLVAKAKAATAKVDKLPARAERPGVAAAPTDGRTAAMQRLAKSGSIQDAGAIFAQIL